MSEQRAVLSVLLLALLLDGDIGRTERGLWKIGAAAPLFRALSFPFTAPTTLALPFAAFRNLPLLNH